MNHDPDITSGAEQPLTPGEAELAATLRQARPLPHPGFRAMLHNRLLTESGTGALRPRRLRLLVAAYASGGLALLAFAAVGVFGAGPLAA